MVYLTSLINLFYRVWTLASFFSKVNFFYRSNWIPYAVAKLVPFRLLSRRNSRGTEVNRQGKEAKNKSLKVSCSFCFKTASLCVHVAAISWAVHWNLHKNLCRSIRITYFFYRSNWIPYAVAKLVPFRLLSRRNSRGTEVNRQGKEAKNKSLKVSCSFCFKTASLCVHVAAISWAVHWNLHKNLCRSIRITYPSSMFGYVGQMKGFKRHQCFYSLFVC